MTTTTKEHRTFAEAEQTNRHGGGATLSPKTPRDYQREAAQAAHRMNQAGIKLHAILDNITSARLAA